jgi:hypothetical protein
MPTTFINKCISGDAFLDEIDLHVEKWHEGKEGDGLELHDYLGMTWDEYSLWGSRPSILPHIVNARKKNISLDNELKLSVGSLAARASSESEASRMMTWLKKLKKI